MATRDRLTNLTAGASLLGLLTLGCNDDVPSTLADSSSSTDPCGDGDGDGDGGGDGDGDGDGDPGPDPFCGDGLIDDGEQCDDANMVETDACLSDCVEATCGDGIVHEGVEGCDDGNGVDDDECSNACAPASCGDAVVQMGTGETCDDGNADNTDGCIDTCVTATCGDGYVWLGNETCDDGDADDTDECTQACAAATCGDGFVWADNEQCDDGNMSNTDACIDICEAATCGDGFVHAGVEDCDDADQDNTDACLDTCAAASCGDGFVRTGVEACDDGNNANDDGCSSTCTSEVYVLTFNDNSMVDDVQQNVIFNWFAAIQGADASDYMYFAVLGDSVNGGAWCSTNANWYRTQFLNTYNSPASANSGNWNRWTSVDGINWSGTLNIGAPNHYSQNCDSFTGSWCSEWGMNDFYLGVMPGRVNAESYGTGYNASTATVTLRYGPTRLSTCGF